MKMEKCRGEKILPSDLCLMNGHLYSLRVSYVVMEKFNFSSFYISFAALTSNLFHSLEAKGTHRVKIHLLLAWEILP